MTRSGSKKLFTSCPAVLIRRNRATPASYRQSASCSPSCGSCFFRDRGILAIRCHHRSTGWPTGRAQELARHTPDGRLLEALPRLFRRSYPTEGEVDPPSACSDGRQTGQHSFSTARQGCNVDANENPSTSYVEGFMFKRRGGDSRNPHPQPLFLTHLAIVTPVSDGDCG